MTASHELPASDDAPPTGAPASHVGQRGLSTTVWIAFTLLAAVVAAAILVQLFVADRAPDLTYEALESAQSRWDEHGPASYDIDFDIRGAQPGIVHVEVRNGEVKTMTRDGVSPKQERTWIYWSVPGRFEEIERELEMAEDPEHEMNADAGTRVALRCEFDPELGYPRAFHRIIYGGGPEVYWRVTRFEPM